ncbi:MULTISPECIES: DUF2489 domain-containing protein [Salinicola]|uniref:DUF2489 domain-containing protein n=1 Tax=Salinicola socius TaxID=404433 RepID=A0A1Q8SPR7_9GAMM|nr:MULTISPECIES: DUF2489 domain-containing protein [Salinicola]OLO03420.1 hypothetical protein BTW07_15230 [Salinicola socius]
MSLPLTVGLCVLAIVIVVLLAAYAWRLSREVKRRSAFRAAEIARANQNCIDSLSALSDAMVARQVDLVEGALRCRVLLDILDHPSVMPDSRRVFDEVAVEAETLHTHQARRELSPRDRHREDVKREDIAQRHDQALHLAAIELQTFCRNWAAAKDASALK